jgi:tetratricopeptide (TPR) repeat protein
MRNFTSALGVRCQFCHVGREGQPLAEFDFASDQKRNKLVARQMMRMVAEINQRLDTIPERGKPPVTATCMTCHRGVSRPIPLSALVQDVAVTSGVDSAVRAYKALRTRYYGRDAYDFSEPSLNIAAFRTAQAGKPDEALALLRYNEEMFPNSSAMAVFKGNIQLMKGDTAAAEAAFREAIRRDSTNAEAKGRLKAIGKTP